MLPSKEFNLSVVWAREPWTDKAVVKRRVLSKFECLWKKGTEHTE